MGGRRARLRFLWIVALAAAAAPRASGFEFFDGRLQIHGAAEEQIRGIARNYSGQDNWDLAQWYNVLELELEYSAVDSGWGPFDLLSFFSRVEARYDCIWTHGCGIFPSVDAWGNDLEHEPLRVVDGRRSGFQGSVFTNDGNGYYGGRKIEPVLDPRASAAVGEPRYIAQYVPANHHLALEFSQLRRIDTLFLVAGPDQNYGTADDPAANVFSGILDKCRFGSREVPGGDNGFGLQIMGGLEPHCRVDNLGRLKGEPNPFSSLDVNPILVGFANPPVGAGALPFRPAPMIPAGTGPRVEAQGIYYPSPALRQEIGKFDSFDQNYSQSALSWNHGASQQDTYELKELYADMEFFDSRLWVRLGKQNIVWGKTELFRTTDQFNPQDLALATLPELEESRIALWSVRGVYSFYTVGPLDDVRLELAANLGPYEPADIGRCGEPFTVFAACNKTTGLFFHGITGFGIAGEERPPNPWTSVQGLEIGSRLEFRWDRFSVQLSDFWGYDDFPYAARLFDYQRLVDTNTGRPLRAGAEGGCSTGTEWACLGQAPFSTISPDGATLEIPPAQQRAVLNETTVNMQLFAMICATSVGFNAVDPTACGQTVFNSLASPLTRDLVPRDEAKSNIVTSAVLSNGLAGNRSAASILKALAHVDIPFVQLNADPCDSFRAGHCGDPAYPDFGPHPLFTSGGPTLNQALSDQQEALLGCGAFYGTDCEVDGIDLANAEASVLMQSVSGAPGSYTDPWHWTTTNGAPQPGTVGFRGGPVATRFVPGRGLVVLPGARGPGQPGYDPRVDGTVAVTGAKWQCPGSRSLSIPCFDLNGNALPQGGFGPSSGQAFKTELAALSFNFQLIMASLSSPPDANNDLKPDGPAAPNEFDSTHPFSTAPGQCSWAQPQFCSVVSSFFDVIGQQRNSVRAAGHDGFGRTDWVWQSGGEVVLRYKKRNVLGLSVDFAEDVTKSNWSIESAWISNQVFEDVDQPDGLSQSGTFNLTISVDRPTFINFLNPNRTFFFNTQIFLQYVPGYHQGFTTNGPWNLLGTFTINTGYFRDRLQPAVTFVFDEQSVSGGILPKLTYRFTSNFSTTIGTNFFFGQFQRRPVPLAPVSAVDTQAGALAYQHGVENGLALVRDRDEVFLRIRYTW